MHTISVTTRFVSGESDDLEFGALSTLADFRQHLYYRYDGIAQIELISTAGDIFTEAYDQEAIEFLPGISEDVEMSIAP